MISEGSCDTEDWMLKIQLSNYILKCIQIENTFVNSNNILKYYCSFCFFDQIDST